jgi:4-hydroxy-4-methyl-2-oxoglutarate aldolase
MTTLTITKIHVLLSVLIFFFLIENSVSQIVPADRVVYYTEEWDGDRFSDGRPMISDDILERMQFVSLEEAWATLRSSGYHNKFEGGWNILHPEQTMVGRALPVAYIPSSPDLVRRMIEKGRAEGLPNNMSQWPVMMLQKGDVYVADAFGKIKDGPVVGNNFAQAIYSNSGNGIIFYGAARDISEQRQIEGYNAWVKDWHPSFIQEMMLISINAPTRIGEAVVLPGDVVLATEGGILFIPPHLAERVILSSELERLVDTFRMQMIREGVFTLEQSYGPQWTDEMNDYFYDWIGTNRVHLHNEYGVGYETLDRIIETRTRNWQEWLN